MSMDSFKEAFSLPLGSCKGLCACGREFYDSSDASWTWDEGEFDALEADPAAEACDGIVGYMGFEGTTYIYQCDCWEPRAERIMAFIDGHIHQIANYINLEKKRLQQEADAAPSIEGDKHHG